MNVLVLAVTIGVLFSVGIYLLMRRSIVRLVIGLAMIGYATNLTLFTITGLRSVAVPVIEEGEKVLSVPFADPLPQALILTAIVIGLGAQALAIVLGKRAHDELETIDMDDLKAIGTEQDQ